MYDLVPGSPEVALLEDLDAEQLDLSISAGSGLVPPMLITLCDRLHFETMLATAYSGTSVTVAARGRQGAARAWPAGTPVLVALTEEQYATMKRNIAIASKPAGSKLYLAETVGAM